MWAGGALFLFVFIYQIYPNFIGLQINAMLNIPANFLDKLKFEIAKVNNPQYFFQFWELTENVDDHVLESAFSAVYDTIPKLNAVLVFQNEKYQYQPRTYQLNFLTMNTSVSLIEYLSGDIGT